MQQRRTGNVDGPCRVCITEGPMQGWYCLVRKRRGLQRGAFHRARDPQKGLAFKAPQHCGSRLSWLDMEGEYKRNRQ